MLGEKIKRSRDFTKKKLGRYGTCRNTVSLKMKMKILGSISLRFPKGRGGNMVLDGI